MEAIKQKSSGWYGKWPLLYVLYALIVCLNGVLGGYKEYLNIFIDFVKRIFYHVFCIRFQFLFIPGYGTRFVNNRTRERC